MSEKSKKARPKAMKRKTGPPISSQNEEEEEDFNPSWDPSTLKTEEEIPVVETLSKESNYMQQKLAQQLKTPIKSISHQAVKQKLQQMDMPIEVFSSNDFADVFEKLPPITTTRNLTELLQTQPELSNLKSFKEYFQEQAPLTGKIICEGSALLADVHLYELSQFDWPYLESIHICGCPHITPFARYYLQMISEKIKDRKLDLSLKLMLHKHNTINYKDDLIDETMTKIQPFFNENKKSSVTKVLIYHTNNTSLLSSNQMILNQFQKSNEQSSMLLNYHSFKENNCQISFLECVHFNLFKNLFASFHPQIIYLVVSNVDDILTWLFTIDSNSSYSILENQRIRLIFNQNQPDDRFFSTIHSRLQTISKSVEELYSQFRTYTSSNTSENDDYRCNQYLSNLLNIRTKCQYLENKLTKDQCLIFKTNDLSSMTKDAIKYSKILYTIDKNEIFNNQISETYESLTKLIDEFKNQMTGKKLNLTELAEIYFTHRIVHDQFLDIQFENPQKSYLISNIDSFCQRINILFNIQTRIHRKNQRLFEQLQHTIGQNLHLIFKHDFKRQKFPSNEIDFFKYLFNSWNLAYPSSIDDQTGESHLFILFNSISTKPAVPLSTIWNETWPSIIDECESKINFHLLHPCDSSILFDLYKLFPSQKLLLVSKSFVLIQEGAMEILIQYHHQTDGLVDLTLTTRLINIYQEESTRSIIIESIKYVLREYFIIIWSYLFKYNYAFQIESKHQDTSNLFDNINGNSLMNSQWKHLSLYHYASSPTLTSVCTICGLHSTATKALYDACATLSPIRQTDDKKAEEPLFVKETSHRSGIYIDKLSLQEFTYINQHCIRPDGCHSFEVQFLDAEYDQLNSPLLSSIQIGCLVNNFDIYEDEKVVFDYGTVGGKKRSNFQSKQNTDSQAFLDEIQNFGGLAGLRRSKTKGEKTKELAELYPGLKLRVEIFFTSKSNIYELVLSVNDIPWSRQTIKRKTNETMFQPYFHCTELRSSEENISFVIIHPRSELDTAFNEISEPKTKENPWKIGMRLEAKDRKNPSICAIANIVRVYDDKHIAINFDGWTSTYDYDVEIDNGDIHPCGYWEYIQRVIYKNPDTTKVQPHFTFTRFDKPKSYNPSFSWRNYLTEINQKPVPFECFSYLQTEGMPLDYFPHSLTKPSYTTLSCRHYFNVRVKYHKMNTFIQDEIVNRILCTHHVDFTNPTATINPGIVLLPTPFDLSTFAYPCLQQFQNSKDFRIHFTCNHRCVLPIDSSVVLFGTHLLDIEGETIEKDALDLSIITISMLTAIDLARNQKRPIAPCTSKLLPKNAYDQNLINFCMKRWLDLTAYITCFHTNKFHTRLVSLSPFDQHSSLLYTCFVDHDLYSYLKSATSSISIKSYNYLTNTEREKQFGKYGECYFCCLFRTDDLIDQSNISLENRLEIVDGYASSIFYFEILKQEKNLDKHHLILNDKFFSKFNGLEIISITNVTIDTFELSSKNRLYLKNVIYLALENNNLAKIDVDFQYFEQLIYLKFVRNPLEYLPKNCLSGQSLQIVEFAELGRLNELDSTMQISSEIKTFSLKETILTTLPSSFASDTQMKLTTLTWNGVHWWGMDGISVNEVVQYETFQKQYLPFLTKDELTDIYQMYDVDQNGVLTYSEINAMNAHIYLYISRLRPSLTYKFSNSGRSSVEPSNKNESDPVQQDVSLNDTSGIPSVLYSLRNLTELNLECQGIKTIPDAIKNLTNLTLLNLKYCIELETLSAHVGLLPLKELNLTGCVSLKTPPVEITRRGHAQTMAFLQRLISGSVSCKRTKLMLVGLGGAGKTSLVRAFLESSSDSPPVVTDGIDIIKWRVPLENADDVLEYSVWDFAGQSVYYHTHQFFLAKKAVYVLAWNIRLGSEHAGLDFWLSSICCHAPNAPIFVVGTHSDQVSRVDLRQDDLKRRYPQIVGFFHVSTYTGENIQELTDSIIKTTLGLPYMDERIPKAWLNFEILISTCKEDIVTYDQAAEIAHTAGIFEASEVLQAIQFLHDLGSLQYFSSEYLKNYVVINPQWIVNVMACIVSIKDSPVRDGRLHHSDIGVIWRDYDEHLHPWILKLTEAFDLTFPVPDQNMNLVPCLLPEEEPEYTWVEDLSETDLKEMKVVYKFNYLPAGLFNRAQVRLFQFSDKSTIWRHGSLLVKNNHRAVIIRTDDQHIVIKIQGVRPDNILFLIHEAFENLVNESFFGVTYDIAFPCPDCVESRTTDPWQFSSSLINRAIELKSPSIQCHRFFHVASVTDLQAIIPPDSKSNYDLHLEYSVRDLKSYKQNMVVDIAYIYPPTRIPSSSFEKINQVDPRKIKEDLILRGLKVWTPDSMEEFKIENHYLVIKGAKTILFGVSTELIEDSKNKNLYDALQTIFNILRKPIIPILFGNDNKWKSSDIGVALSDKLYVNMQDSKRYEYRMNELIDLINEDQKAQNKTQFKRDQPTDVFISYCWANSHDAVNKGTKPTATSLGWGDPRAVKDYLEARGLQIWMDITRLGKSGVLHDIVQGLKSTKLIVACVSDEYSASEVCRNEFLFAKNTLRLPVILAIFGAGDKWRVTEVGMCSLTCPQINFQFENPTAFEDIYDLIQNHLPKRPISAKETSSNVIQSSSEQTTTAAYQELFELTQRKFLRLTSGFAETMTARAYPRLFALDYLSDKEKSAQELARIEISNSMNTQRPQNDDEKKNEREIEAEIVTEENSKEQEAPKEKLLCIRVLCENEENWHTAGSPFEITDPVILQNSSSYLSRIMLLLKHSELTLDILNTDVGENQLQKLNELAQSTNMEVKDAYVYLRRCIMDYDLEDKYSGLTQCLMPSGKVLWLCEEHKKQPRVVTVTNSLAGGYQRPQVEEKSEMVKALAKLNERIANNEIPPPSIKVLNMESTTHRLSITKRLSKRFSRQESLISKCYQQNLEETAENDDDEEENQSHINGENENADQASTSTECSIM